ncbi:hypothetical protein RUM44_004408 [Polyplax serrata]|uniref:Uncharacterized protein n=1 Tax=Polyplax serrata TaxID=468196 RepID=A0ABR1B2R1_POLSC
MGTGFSVKSEPKHFREIQKNLNPPWVMPKKIFSMQKHRNDVSTSKLDVDRSRTSLDFVEIGSYLEVVGKIWPLSDDYKIVFISSDSSTKENRSISTDSDTGSAESGSDSFRNVKKLASDCDWDYFDSSSIVRPVMKDWNWHGSPRGFSGTLRERSSPVFSTSDDNSPKFPRRSLNRFSVRDSPISCDTDVSGFSPNLQRKIMDIDENKFRAAESPKSVDVNDESHAEEKEIEITDLKVSPPIKSKELHMIKENVNQKMEIQSFTNSDIKPEETKKSKKRRKNKKTNKGSLKDDEIVENLNESKDMPAAEKNDGSQTGMISELEENVTEKDPAALGLLKHNLVSSTEKKETEELTASGSNLSPDGVNPIAGSVDGTEPKTAVVQAGEDQKESPTKGKGKSKKQKNKKRCEKCSTVDPKSDGLSGGNITNESAGADSSDKLGDLVANEYTFPTGSFGYQPQNLISAQTLNPGVLTYNCPVSNVLENANVFKNFVPIPVPVLIPVPFPVPTAIWSQNYQNFTIPNLNLGTENIDMLKNFQNICAANYMNQARNETKEVSFGATENNSSGTGSGSIHIRAINMQRPALAMGPLPGCSQGSVNSAESDLTCLTSSEHQLVDNDKTRLPADSVEKSDCSQEVVIDGVGKVVSSKKTKKGKKKYKKLTLHDDLVDVTKEEDEKNEIMVNGVDSSGCPPVEKCDLNVSNIFVERKTFREVKNLLKHKNDLVQETSRAPSEQIGIDTNDNVSETVNLNGFQNVIVIDDTINCEDIDSSLLKIDRKSDYSSTSHSDDSDENLPSRKPFKKSYYFNRRDSEEKTSGDSDIADVNSSEEETKTDNSSQGNSSASEDEGNPDSSRFSEVYVVNPLDGDEPLKKLKSSEWSKDSSKGSKQSKKLKEMLPLKNFPVSDGTDSDSEGQESSVVLLKHVKKLPEDDLDIQVERNNFEEQVEVNTESLEIDVNCSTSAEPENEIARTTKEPEHLPKQQEAGVAVPVSQYEDPVSLLPELIKPESGSASVAESELVPGSVHEVLFNSNNSEPVSSEINSVPFQSFENKIGASSSALENANGTRLKVSGNESSNKSAEPTRYLRDGDVNYNADSEVTKSDLLKEILATHLSGPVDVFGGDTGKNSSDGNSLSDHISTKGNENGPSLLDTIENRIRHFSQLDNFNVPPRRNEAKYTSLIMITPDKNGKSKSENNLVSGDSVKVITTNTTKVWNKDNAKQLNDDIFLKHTNRKNEDEESGGVHKLKSLEDYYTMTLENSRGLTISPKKPNVIKNMTPLKEEDEGETQLKEEVQVVTDGKTLSAVICLEEGLADDDSWVEDLEKDRENDFVAAVTEEDSSSGDETHIGACIPVHTDREEELRGYHRGAINFTLHTIVEESCEDSEVEDKTKLTVTKKRPTSVTELEKYFYFDIGGGVTPNFESKDVDTFSESSSSIYSDGGVIDETGGEVRENSDQNQLSTSMLEKYFLNFDRDGREKESDGSVGSDSEGPPSPEQRRKRLFRARASNRLHSNSLDNLVQSENEQQSVDMVLDSEDSSTETDIPESQMVDKSDDSVKRKKKRKISGGSLNVPLTMQDPDKKVNADGEVGKEIRDSLSREHFRELKEEMRDHEVDEIKNGNLDHESDDERSKTPQPEFLLESGLNRDKQQSRDSGFIGSCDDLLKDQKTGGNSSGSDTKKKSTDKSEKKSNDAKEVENPGATVNRQPIPGMKGSTPPATGLTRKDSFNNWSSDEETNLMMSKMRQFFKAMVSVPKNSNKMPDNSNPSSPQVRTKGVKSPQLVYFENELTRLMKTVPGIRDDQVREIVEYLSSEDTWSDSYDSSDYTSSDLEGTAAYYQRTQLQQEISESCKQIIDKFDQSKSSQEQKPKVPPRRNSSPMNRETALVYQKLVASFNKITNENENPTSSPHSSPPLFAKVMHHIGSRLVALMHEVSSNSSGEGSISSHKSRYHKRISQKLSNVSSTTEEECGLTDESDCKASDTTNLLGQNMPYFHLLHQLPRSKSHDLLLEEAKVKSLRSSSSGVSDILEEKEASDYERFSWRGSFESALMADSRSKLTLLSNDSHSSNTTLAAKRRSAGDLLFLKSLSRDQLDRVRSCGSIGGVSMEDKNIWTTGRERNGRRRSSVPDATSPGSGASADGDEDSSDSEIIQERSITLPRSLQSVASSQNTNSLPRLPTTGATNTQNLSKAQSVQHFLPNAKSARYRPPGFSRMQASSPKRAVSAPGLQVLQPSHARRDRRRNQNYLAGNTSLSGGELKLKISLMVTV